MSADFLAFVECAGCGGQFPVHNRYAFARAKWCSERCRKAQYRQPCERCGAPCGGSDKSRFCTPCGTQYTGERVKAASAAHRALIERLWAEGLTIREIAARIGCTPESAAAGISRLRRQGVNLPYRRTPEQRARIAQGSDARMEKARAALQEQRAA